MKSKFFAAIFLSIAFVTSSFAVGPKRAIAIKEIAIMAPFEKIVVGEYINVVLVQDPYRLTVTVSGDEKYISSVKASIVNNQLRISSKKYLEGKKITVYVPVANLSTVELAAGSSVSGEGILNFEDLTVVVNTGSHAELSVLGKMTIKSGDDCDFIYEKDERYKVISSAL